MIRVTPNRLLDTTAGLGLARPAVVLFCFVLSAGCQRESAPGTPEVGGPGGAQPRDTAVFWALSHSREGQNLSFYFDWGEEACENWSAQVAPGETLRRSHVYGEPGRYSVRAMARDERRLESGWSEPLAVDVGFLGPETPTRPCAPVQVYPDTTVSASCSAGHVRAESTSIQFDWGDGVGGWSEFAPAGTLVADSHSFELPGSYAVRAHARDRSGHTSPWSEPETVLVMTRPVEAPSRLSVAALAGTTVAIRWDGGRNSDSVLYALWFRNHSTGEFEQIDTAYRWSVVHDPFGATGEYTVSARFRGDEKFAAETLSTAPVHSDTLVMHELNTGLLAGYGWSAGGGIAGLFSMADSASAPFVDVYFTDLAPGYAGPGYYMAGPALGPEDPGGGVPPAGWRKTGLLALWGNTQDPLPEYDSLLYDDLAYVNTVETYLAVYTRDGYYALMVVGAPKPDDGSVPVVSWFQKVRGLRLVEHEEPLSLKNPEAPCR